MTPSLRVVAVTCFLIGWATASLLWGLVLAVATRGHQRGDAR
jgi:hypothetical protein